MKEIWMVNYNKLRKIRNFFQQKILLKKIYSSKYN